MSLNAKQLGMYRAEWGKTRKALRDYGRTPAEADAKRKELHTEAGAVKKDGTPKSSLELTNPELTNILGLFWVWSYPADLERQLRQIGQKWEHYAAGLLEACEVESHGRAAYLDAICRRIYKKPLAELKMPEWPDIIGALNHTRMHKQGIAHGHRATAPKFINDLGLTFVDPLPGVRIDSTPPSEESRADFNELVSRCDKPPAAVDEDQPF